MSAYYTMIWSRIKSKWALPQGILPSEVLEVVIDVTILRNGAVTQVSFEKRSGNRYFDDSAMKAIQRASPLPPLPANFRVTRLPFHDIWLARLWQRARAPSGLPCLRPSSLPSSLPSCAQPF